MSNVDRIPEVVRLVDIGVREGVANKVSVHGADRGPGRYSVPKLVDLSRDGHYPVTSGSILEQLRRQNPGEILLRSPKGKLNTSRQPF